MGLQTICILDNCNYREAYIFMPAMEFYSIMKAQSGAKRLLLEKYKAL